MNNPLTPVEVLGSDAEISECGEYRYRLRRWWVEQPQRWVLWIMLNPSTADASVNDNTIRRCIAFSQQWGFDGLMVGNLFGLRSTDPKQLRVHPQPEGMGNLRAIYEMSKECEQVICAWGADKSVNYFHSGNILNNIQAPAFCLGKTKAGHPKHPLYLASETLLEPYR